MTDFAETQIAERLEFIDIGHDEQELLKAFKPLIMASIGPALDGFYAKVRSHKETSRFFASEAHVSHAKEKQAQHWDVIASGDFTGEYVKRVRAIGSTHARLGLEPRWYIGGYALVAESLIGAMVEEMWPRVLGRKIGRSKKMAHAISTLVKSAMLDMDLAISIYLEVLEKKRKDAEEIKAKSDQEQAHAMSSMSAALEMLAAGDLTVQISEPLAPQFDQLKSDFNRSVSKLKETMVKVAESTTMIASGAKEISSASDDLSRRTEQQAASLEQTAAALDEITATVRRAAEGTTHATKVVASAKADAHAGGKVVRDAVGAMHDIEKASGQISQIIGVIDEIAFQTNLLALNAGVEAARAGDAGRGFAVVASEVRALAQRAATAAKEIKSLINTSTTHVSLGVDLVGRTGKSLEVIIGQIDEINGIVSEIAAGAKEQAIGLQEVNTAVNQMDQTTQQNAAMVEQATAAGHSLTQETNDLTSLIAQFSTGVVVALHAEAVSGPAAVAVKAPAAQPRMTYRPAKSAVKRTAARQTALAERPAVSDENWKDF